MAVSIALAIQALFFGDGGVLAYGANTFNMAFVMPVSGYLVYRFYPEPNRRVFVFGEAALMGDDFLNEYQDVQTLRPNWEQVLDKYQVDYVLYNHGEALANVLASEPDRWTLVYSDDVAVIYVRRSNTATPSALNAGAPSPVGGVSEPNPRVQST